MKEVSKNRELIEENDFVTSVCVTNCGNFGVLGYNSGKIIKFNM